MSTWLTTSTAPDGTVFRDLAGTGVMEPYENPNLPTAQRVSDLLARMTLEEKVGQMFQPSIEAGPDGELVEEGALVMPRSTTETLQDQYLSHFNVLQLPAAREAALWHNRVQRAAEQTRLGIPVTISTDPRHSDVENIATQLKAGAFSAWPEALGLAALRDPGLVEEFARTAREEYLAVGIRAALHPQIDLATDPRWARQSTTFGPESALTSDYLQSYLRGFQGEALGAESVACMTKHFPGGGPQKDGEDPHFPYGREQIYPGGKFEYHLEPFRVAVAAGTSAIMPYYGMPVGLVRKGREIEEVGFGFNRQIIEGILRDELGFDGVVCTDWQLVSDVLIDGHHLPARAWGVEHLDRHARVEKILRAGCDQLGGETCTEILIDLVHSGRVTVERIDESVRRLLAVKFDLGLFDNPYVDEESASSRVGTDDAVRAGHEAQVASVVLLSRADEQDGATLPDRRGQRVYLEGIAAEELAGLGTATSVPEDADVAVIRLGSPFTPRNDFFLEPFFHAGTLEFGEEVVARVTELAARLPLILEVTLDRPAVLTSFAGQVEALLGSFGSGGRSILEVALGAETARGRLPFDLPRTSASVERSQPDTPFDLDDVLFSAAGDEQ